MTDPIQEIITRYRKKPVVIEAIRWMGDVRKIAAFMSGDDYFISDSGILNIITLEGPLSASEGDWIIRGIKGEFYPCKPDIFAATYEPVEK